MAALKQGFMGLLGVSAFAVLATPGAYAQSSTDTASSDTIVVTARQRSEELHDVPAQVTAFNAAAIEDRGIQRPADFIAQVPNVTFVETQNAGTSFLVIRGISQARNSEPSAAIVVDGVPMTQPAQFNQELIDIQQIEVLKGPQGALYGRNAIGGAILITTRHPGGEFEGKLTAGYESGPGYRLQGTASTPISDNFWVRGAVSYFDTDGHLSNVNTTDAYTNKNADPVQDFNARLSFLYEPTSDLSIDLRLAADNLNTRALYYVIPDFSDPGFNDPNNTSRDINLNNTGINTRDIYDGALKVSYDTEAGTFTSITGYNSVEEVLTGDGYTFDPFGQSRIFFDFNQSQFLDVNTWTQELRFTSPSTGNFRWIAGGQFFKTDRFIATGNELDTGNGVIPVRRSPTTDPLHFQLSYLADSQKQTAYALYFDTSTNLTDQLELSVNLRYDSDKRENTTDTPTSFLPCTPGPDCAQGLKRSHTWDDLQPQVILRYELSDTFNIYGSYSRGFRSGGFNQTGVGAVAQANGFFNVGDLFDQETADTFEVGLKTTFLNGRGNFSASAYHTKDQGGYYFVFLAANSTQNLGSIDETIYKGVDLELNARLTDHFQINAGLGFTDSEITKFPDPVVVGAKAPLVSDYTFNLGAQYTTDPIIGDMEGIVRVDYNRIGDTVFTIPFSAPSQALDATPKERDPVNLVDLRVGLQNGSWSITAWSRNLFDEEYNSEYSPGGFLFKAQPMRWGIDLSRRF